MTGVMEEQEQASVDAARDEMMEMPWPEGNTVTRGVTSLHDAASHAEQYDRFGSEVALVDPPLAPGESSLEFSEASNTWTYSRAIQSGMVSIAEKYGDRAVFMGEDMEIAGAFGMMLSLIAKGHSDKLLDMPLSESVIVHSATGAALGDECSGKQRGPTTLALGCQRAHYRADTSRREDPQWAVSREHDRVLVHQRPGTGYRLPEYSARRLRHAHRVT